MGEQSQSDNEAVPTTKRNFTYFEMTVNTGSRTKKVSTKVSSEVPSENITNDIQQCSTKEHSNGSHTDVSVGNELSDRSFVLSAYVKKNHLVVVLLVM